MVELDSILKAAKEKFGELTIMDSFGTHTDIDCGGRKGIQFCHEQMSGRVPTLEELREFLAEEVGYTNDSQGRSYGTCDDTLVELCHFFMVSNAS